MSQSLDIIYAAIEELNAQIADEGPGAQLIAKAEDTALFGADDGMDSLQLVNLIVAIENHIQDATGQSVVLVDESTMGLDNNPFETVGSLAAHLDGVLS
jgi:acyl carrier protein